jgi:2-dehydropantoate 2-reductase
MRHIVIGAGAGAGAGAVGGAVGGRLAQAGREVVLVARGRHLAALGEHGLRLRVPEGESLHRLPALEGPGPLGELRSDDVLVLAVKTQNTVAALEAWADVPVAGGGTAAERLPLVCLQNGVEGGRLALRRFRQVYAVCVWLPSTFLEPGVVRSFGAPLTGILHLGRLPHGTDRRRPPGVRATKIRSQLPGTGRASARRQMDQENKRGMVRDTVPLAD